MKFKSRTQEHIVRSTIALGLTLLILLYKDDKFLLNYLFGQGAIVTIIQIATLILIGWLAFGKLRTPVKKL